MIGRSRIVETRSGEVVLLVRRERTRVVVAEDDDELRRLIAHALRDDGYEVIEARSGMELLDQLSSLILSADTQSIPHVVVSDIRMPGVTGLEILDGLRASRGILPFILITAFGDADTHQEALRLGAVTVLDKPFRLRELKRVLRGVMPPWTWADGMLDSPEKEPKR